MLYLIESPAMEDINGETKYFKILKIGYTSNEFKDKRFDTYSSHNPTCKVLKIIDGATQEHESKVKYKFRDLLFTRQEWFRYDQSIIDFFNTASLIDLELLPNNPKKLGEKLVKIKKEIKFLLSFVFDTKDEVNKQFEYLLKIFGDKIGIDVVLDYLTNNNIDLTKYLKYKESEETGIFVNDKELNKYIVDFFKQYNLLTTLYDKLKLLCNYSRDKLILDTIVSFMSEFDSVRIYYVSLGPDKIRKLGYSITKIKKELGIITFTPDLLFSSVYSDFKVGDRIPLSIIKERLGNIYDSISYKETPKAIDIQNYFKIKEIVFYEKKEDGGRKQIRGYELLESYEQIYRNKFNKNL